MSKYLNVQMLQALFSRKTKIDEYVAFVDDAQPSFQPNIWSLDLDEKVAIKLSLDTLPNFGCITTKRVIWQHESGLRSIFFADVADARTEKFGSVAVSLADTLVILTKSGSTMNLKLPSSSVVAGVWSILSHYARLNKHK
jgi:hypothetical protein